MSAEEFLRSTPPEINWKVEAWNDRRRADAHRDYNFAILLVGGWHKPEKFPSFERFYPELTKDGQQKTDRQVSKAMNTAKALGDI